MLLVAVISAQAQKPLPKLRVSDNKRFLSTTDGKPFFYLADTGWELFHRLDRKQALTYLDRMVVMRPDFAEGWNKRATVYFLMGDFDQSLADCDETLKRNPNHFGALAGCGAIYAQRGELEQALEYFERALEVNPNMPGVEQALGLVRERLATAGRRST